MFPTTTTLHYRPCPPELSQHVNQQYLGWCPPFPAVLPDEHQMHSQKRINDQFLPNRSLNNISNILYRSSLNHYQDVPSHVSSNGTTNDSWDAYSHCRTVTNPRPDYNPASCQYSSYSLNQHVRERSTASFNPIETSAFINHQCYATQPSNAVQDYLKNPHLVADSFRTSRRILENIPSPGHFIEKDLGFLNDHQRHCNPFPPPPVSHEKTICARWPPSMPCASPRLSSHNQHKTTQNRVKRLPQTAFHLPPRQYVENSLGRESVLPSARSDGAYGSAKAHHDALNQPLAQTASCVNSHVSQCTKVARSEHDSAICSINQYSCEAGSEQFLGNSACRYASQYVNPRGSEQYQGNSTFKEFTPGQTPRIVSSVPDIIGVQSHVDSQMSLRKQFSCSSKDDCREVAALMKKRSGTEGVGKHGLLERNKITHLCQGVQQFVEEKDVDVMRKIYKTNKTCRRTLPAPASLLVVQPTDQETDVVGESLVVASDKSECIQHVQLQSESIETTQSTPASHSAFCERIYPGKPDNVDNTSHRIEEEQLVITSGHSETHIKVVDVKKESKAMAFHPASEVSVTNTNKSHSAFCERIYPGKPDNVDNTSHRIEEEQLVITSGHSETHIKVVDVKKESKAMAFHPASEVSVTNTNNNSLGSVISHQDESDILIIDLFDDVSEDSSEIKDSSNKMETSYTQKCSHHKRDLDQSWDADSPKCSALHKNNDDRVISLKDTATNLETVSEPLAASTTSPANCNKAELKTPILTMAETFLSFNCGSIKDSNMLSPSSTERDMLSPVSSEIGFSCKASFDQICSGKYVVLEAHSLRSDECDFDTTTESQPGTSFANTPKIMKSHCLPLHCPGGTENIELENLKSISDPDSLKQQPQHHLQDSKYCTLKRQIPKIHKSHSDHSECGTAKLKAIELKRRHSGVEQCIDSSKLKILSSGQIFRVKKRRVNLFAQTTVMCDQDNTVKTQKILEMDPEDTRLSCEGQRIKGIIKKDDDDDDDDDDSKRNYTNISKQLAAYQVLPKDHMHTMSSSEMQTVAEQSYLPKQLKGLNGSQGIALSSNDDCTAHSASRKSTIHRPNKALKKDRDLIVGLHKDIHRPFGIHRLMPFSIKSSSSNHLVCLKCKILFSCEQKFLQHQLIRHAHFIIK